MLHSNRYHLYMVFPYIFSLFRIMRDLFSELLYCPHIYFLGSRLHKKTGSLQTGSRQIAFYIVSISRNYSMISDTTPEPTVLPPSRIANLKPSSIAIGLISSISIVTLSPGMHISVPAGNDNVPVMSVVLK